MTRRFGQNIQGTALVALSVRRTDGDFNRFSNRQVRRDDLDPPARLHGCLYLPASHPNQFSNRLTRAVIQATPADGGRVTRS